jgi:hypothetical protein
MWIKVEPKIMNHRKTFVLAEELDLEPVQVVGHLVSLWGWVMDNCPTGVLPQNDRMIAKAAQWDGAPEPFVRALVHAGFVDDDYMGTMEIHDWHEYAGALIRKRREDVKRMQQWREKKRC